MMSFVALVSLFDWGPSPCSSLSFQTQVLIFFPEASFRLDNCAPYLCHNMKAL